MDWQVFGGFDLVAGLILLAGVFRGRARGMSVEALDLLQWVLIVGAGGLTYLWIGRLLAQLTGISLLAAYLAAYAGAAILIKLMVTLFKRSIGSKLVEGEFFGTWEYYLGMLAGGLRFACIILFFLAFLNAKLVTDKEFAAQQKMQEQNFGTISFPTLGGMQRSIFRDSMTGRFVHRRLPFLLIAATKGKAKHPATLRTREERDLEEILRSN